MASSTAEEPLLSNQPGAEEEDEENQVNGDISLLLEKNLSKPGLFVWLLTFSAGISGLLFGYDTGVISSTLISLHTSLGRPLTTLDKSLITSCTSLFALLISPLSGVLASSFGRKRVVLLADLAFVLGALIQAFTTTVWGMILGRSIVGLAVGAGSFVAPLYISELAPSMWRGRLVVLNVLFITLGQVVAYIVGWAFVEWGTLETGWRWMVGLGALPALVQILVMLVMPETPRWLVQVGRVDEGRSVLNKVFGTGLEMQKVVDAVLKGIVREVREEDEAKRLRGMARKNKGSEDSWISDAKDSWEELIGVGGNRRALIIACLLQGLQQLCGFNSLMYFSATIFTILGFSSPTLTSLSVALTNFVLTCAALLLIDRIGRRRILLISIPIMILGLLLCSIGFHFMDLPSTFSTSTTYPLHETSSNPASSLLLILLSITIYTASFALGLGNVPWMQSELFPLSVRSLGSSLSTCTNWSANFIIGLTFLPMMEFLSPQWTFVVYAAVCAAGWVAIWNVYPETRGLGLEEVGVLLRDGWGLGEGQRRRRG
ncbi:17e228d7-ecdf-468f-a12a-67f90c9af624 [Sclerotinia trifoliorum]|uniref:17e228d7-ecdf-468f-a12a-67f90c9af624 n=1 Tax=Sclerotinia trifoliorum TaxID=28548 RepID=A0A8H2ZN44_9HELO|nr:17e228d7-ecdf-468f-a12a-67f90c9af624 [Sclerotinia trifoliorum]